MAAFNDEGVNLENHRYDLLGLGLGPANLALATAIEERVSQHQHSMSCLFIDKKPGFKWHSGMLLPGAKLQVPFVRDLATLRNPQSRFTFINFLKEKHRLDHFINLRTFYPTRAEFNEYLLWVAQQLSHLTQFNKEIIAISPQWDKKQGNIPALKITCIDQENQQPQELLARNLVLGLGKQPFIPECAQKVHPHILHTHNLIPHLLERFADFQKAYEFVVVGSGQSAGEATLYLLNHYPNARVHLCFRSFALKGIDNSPFVNQHYHQAAIDHFYQLENSAKIQTLKDLKQSNYAVIDAEVLANLTQINYEDLLNNKSRLMIHPGLDLKAVSCDEKCLQVIFAGCYQQTCQPIQADGLILATGYTQKPVLSLLTQLEEFLCKHSDNSYQISRDYQLISHPRLHAGIYLQGYCENTHGPSDASLAVIATRAEHILQSIANRMAVTTQTLVEKQVCN